MDFLRGEGPILPKSAERLGYSRNTSPIARLVEGYRRVDAGRRSLIPGDGKGPIHEQTREWAKKFWSGVPEYQSDEKWWSAVESHESRKNGEKLTGITKGSPDSPDQDAVLAALGINSSDTPPAPTMPLAGKPASAALPTRDQRMEALVDSITLPELSKSFGLPDLGSFEVETYMSSTSPLNDDLGNVTPVWITLGAGATAKAFIDPKHQLFSRFGVSYADALLTELAPLLKTRAESEISTSQIMAELKNACLPDTAVTFDSIKNRAYDLVLEIREMMSKQVVSDPQQAVQYLTPDERSVTEVALVNDGGQYTADVWTDGKFLLYVPPLYLAKLLESWPEVFMDGQVFVGPHNSLSSPAIKRLSVARVAGYINDLATVLTAQTRPTLAQLQRTRWSCDLLANEIAG